LPKALSFWKVTLFASGAATIFLNLMGLTLNAAPWFGAKLLVPSTGRPLIGPMPSLDRAEDIA
jgi:hypothetical protein